MKIVTLCFVVREGEVLLAEKKQGFGVGFLNGYGGKTQEGESPEVAVVRELAEEAGIVVSVTNLEKVAVMDFFEADKQIFECHIFFAKNWEGEPAESDEMGTPEWFPLSGVPYDRMWKSDRDWLPLIFSGQKIHGKAYYKAGMNEINRFESYPFN